METLLTVEETADTFKVRVETVRRWLREGTLRGRKIGRIWRIPESEVNQLGTGSQTTSIKTNHTHP